MADISNITVSAEGVNTVCEIKDKVARNNIALNRTTLGYQCKNLLKNTAVTKTVNGVTFTVNSDGSITATQTTTSPSNATIKVATMTLKPGTYILTGDDEIRLSGFGAIRFYVGSTIYSSNKPHTFDTEVTIDVWLFVWQGVNINGSKTIYPMLRYADITDDTYEPYKESVDERLIQNKSDIAVNKSTLGYQCKNLFNPNAVNWYQPTKTSIAKDGTITSTATSDSRVWSYENAEYFLTLSAGKYIVRTVTETIDDTASINENIRGYNESGTQLFDIYPNAIGTRTTSFTLTETAKIAIMFKLFTQTCKIMIHDADITDSTYEPYKENVDERLIQNKSDIIINKTTLGTQCKNLHDTLSVNWYQPGKTSVASDGTVTTTITSDSRNFTYANSEHYITLEAGNYIITANTLKFAAGSSALIRGCNSDNQSLFALSVSSAGLHKAAFSLSKKTTIGIMYKLYSQTCTIMIRDADILGDTYETYSDNVDTRLIENKSNTAINKSTLGYQCKNLLKNNAVTKTVNGITFTVNDDKSVTLNGASTAQADFYLRGAWGSTSEILQKNKYIASIGVSQSSIFNGVVMHCINNTTSIGSPSCNYPSLAVNSAITAVYISVSKGYTFSNYKLYPMIRYADITDDTYEPYQPSVQEQITALEERIAALGG